MIEILGQAPINTAVKAGLDKFYSVFTRKPTGAATGALTLTPRAYTSTRGLIIRKEDIQKASANLARDGYYFQFNPEKVSDSKGTEWSVIPYPGLNYNDYAWGHGGERILTFQLFLDDTPGSHTAGFRPEAYDSKLAWELQTEGVSAGQRFVQNARETLEGIVNGVADPTRGLGAVPTAPNFQWKENSAFSNTRMSERGVMDVVDKITQFLYPAHTDTDRPKFASGGIVDDAQFRPPSTAVLVLGPRYFEGIVKSAPVEYTLFDTDLTPIRATINVEFAAYEFADVHSIYESKLKQV